MKFVIDNNKFIVFLNKKLDLDNKLKLEKYFKKLFNKIKNQFDIEVNGYYNIDIYSDKHYGMIIEIIKEDLDYYNYFNQIDMEINIIKNDFYYEIDYDYFNKDLLSYCSCYKYNGKLYLKIKDNINFINIAKLLEFSKIIYKNDKIKYGKKVNL